MIIFENILIFKSHPDSRKCLKVIINKCTKTVEKLDLNDKWSWGIRFTTMRVKYFICSTLMAHTHITHIHVPTYVIPSE